MTFNILFSEFNAFAERLFKLNKKIAKYNHKIEILKKEKFMHPLTKIVSTPNGTSVVNLGEEERVSLTITDLEVVGKENVTFLGVLSYVDNLPQIHSETDKYNLRDFVPESRTAVCNHCGTMRKRVKYFFFEENNEVKLIGSSCAVEYFGIDPEKVLYNFITFGQEIETLSEGYRGERPQEYVDTDLLLKCLSYETHRFKTQWGSGSTATSVKMLLSLFYNKNATEEMREIMKDILSINITNEQKQAIKDRWSLDTPTSDFEFNIASIINTDTETLRTSVAYKVLGVFCWASWKVLNDSFKGKDKEVLENTTESVPSDYVGTEGKRETFSVVLTDVFYFDTQYGTIGIHKFTDENGNTLVWKTASDLSIEKDEKVTLTGTVKEHLMYRDEKQTILTRCKIVK